MQGILRCETTEVNVLQQIEKHTIGDIRVHTRLCPLAALLIAMVNTGLRHSAGFDRYLGVYGALDGGPDVACFNHRESPIIKEKCRIM